MTGARCGVVGAWLALMAASCGAPPAPAARADSPGRATTLRIEVAANDATNIPRLMAVDRLRAQGYTVEAVSYASNPLVFTAMQHGDVDVAAVPDVMGWNAISRGVPVFALMDESRMTLVLLAARTIRQCSDLDGRPVAVSAANGATHILFTRYIAQRCPGAAPHTLNLLGGSAARLAALQSGAVVATPIELYDYLRLAPSRASELHELAWFSDEFPGLSSVSLFMRRQYAEAYPDTARDLVRAILEARRRIQDPAVLARELAARLGMEPGEARVMAAEFLARRIWNLNGGHTLGSLQRSIDFYHDGGALPAGIRADQVADLSFLEAVLAAIGHRPD